MDDAVTAAATHPVAAGGLAAVVALVLREVLPWVFQAWQRHRQNAVEDGDRAYDRLSRMYTGVAGERDNYKDKVVSLMVEVERLKGMRQRRVDRIFLLEAILKDKGVPVPADPEQLTAPEKA